MTEKYFKKRIALHYFGHQIWLVFISISSRLVEMWPIPSPRDASEQSFLTTLRYSHARLKAAASGLFLSVEISYIFPQASATRQRSQRHATPVYI